MMVLLVDGKFGSVIDFPSSKWILAKNVPTRIYPDGGATSCKSLSFKANREGQTPTWVTGRREKERRRFTLRQPFKDGTGDKSVYSHS